MGHTYKTLITFLFLSTLAIAGSEKTYTLNLVVTGNLISESKIEVANEDGQKTIIDRSLVDKKLKLSQGTKIQLKLDEPSLIRIFAKPL